MLLEGVPSNSPTSGQGLFFLKKFKKNFIKTLDFLGVP
nr:MAG TPA: hypothetical protein [Caudoviricetes sp.]